MLKNIVLTAPLLAMGIATAAAANEEPTNVVVYDHTTTVSQAVPVTDTYCREVQVPVYKDVQVQGNGAEGALAGMIIGGLIGKGATGKDNGAAAGAVIGGLIGADRSSKPRTDRRRIGYEMVEKCDTMNTVEYVNKEVYSHSTIRFYLDGMRYVLRFERSDR